MAWFCKSLISKRWQETSRRIKKSLFTQMIISKKKTTPSIVTIRSSKPINPFKCCRTHGFKSVRCKAMIQSIKLTQKTMKRLITSIKAKRNRWQSATKTRRKLMIRKRLLRLRSKRNKLIMEATSTAQRIYCLNGSKIGKTSPRPCSRIVKVQRRVKGRVHRIDCITQIRLHQCHRMDNFKVDHCRSIARSSERKRKELRKDCCT